MQVAHDQLTLQLNQYIGFLQDVKKSSPNTLLAYRRDLEKFFGFADLCQISSFSSLSVDQIEEYKQYLLNLGLSSSSVCRTLSSLRSLFRYLMSVGEIENNPARGVHNEKIKKKDLDVLTSTEVNQLLSLPDTRNLKGMRDKAMLELLYATGLKVSELIGLDVSDVNTQMGFVRCGTQDSERFIPLYPVAVKALSAYLSKSRKFFVIDPNETALFVNINGERMTRQGFWKLMKGYVQEAGITKPITPQSLRNAFAAHLLENGADIHDIQEILGHKDPASTQRYAQYLKDKMSKSYMKFHPRA